MNSRFCVLILSNGMSKRLPDCEAYVICVLSLLLVKKCVGMCTYRLKPLIKLPKYKTKVYSEVAGEYKLFNY